jgi:hypothetical protein
MDGRSSASFSTKARLGSFATQLEDAAAGVGLGSSDPDLPAMPSWAPGGILGTLGAVVAADEKLSKPPNPPKSSPATDAAGGLTAAATAGGDAKSPNPPKSSPATDAAGGLAAAATAGGDAKSPNPPKSSPATDAAGGTTVAAAAGGDANPPNPLKSSLAVGAAGGLTAAAAGDKGAKLSKASLPNRVLAGNVLKPGWSAFDIVGTVTGAGGGIISAPVDEVSCSRGIPSACRRLCSRTEFDHDQASCGDSKVCQIDVFQAGTPGSPTYDERGRRGEPGHGMPMHMHIQWHMRILWEEDAPAARASGPALGILSYRRSALGRTWAAHAGGRQPMPT